MGRCHLVSSSYSYDQNLNCSEFINVKLYTKVGWKVATGPHFCIILKCFTVKSWTPAQARISFSRHFPMCFKSTFYTDSLLKYDNIFTVWKGSPVASKEGRFFSQCHSDLNFPCMTKLQPPSTHLPKHRNLIPNSCKSKKNLIEPAANYMF